MFKILNNLVTHLPLQKTKQKKSGTTNFWKKIRTTNTEFPYCRIQKGCVGLVWFDFVIPQPTVARSGITAFLLEVARDPSTNGWRGRGDGVGSVRVVVRRHSPEGLWCVLVIKWSDGATSISVQFIVVKFIPIYFVRSPGSTGLLNLSLKKIK